MYFTSNHDENSWNGTVQERMGDAGEAMAILSYTIPGMGLVYSGQEAGLDKRLRFFEKDTINWDNMVYENLYTKLNNLKKHNKALWNGENGGSMTRLNDGSNQYVFAFIREKEGDKVITIINLSNKPQEIVIDLDIESGKYKNVFSGEELVISKNDNFELLPWAYLVLTN